MVFADTPVAWASRPMVNVGAMAWPPDFDFVATIDLPPAGRSRVPRRSRRPHGCPRDPRGGPAVVPTPGRVKLDQAPRMRSTRPYSRAASMNHFTQSGLARGGSSQEVDSTKRERLPTVSMQG